MCYTISTFFMSKRLTHFFIPHAENNYHPHSLHSARIFFYGFFGVVVKSVAVIAALLLPDTAFVIPEVIVAEQGRVIELTNEVRAREGVAPLVYEEKLALSSLYKADDMAELNYFDHVGPDGRRLRDFLRDVGYTYSVAGENLAVGFSSPEAMVQAWVESPTHFANLIDTDFDQIGVGGSVGVYGGFPAIYIVQHFGKPRVVDTRVEIDSLDRVRGVVDVADAHTTLSSYYDFDASYLQWREGDGTVQLDAYAEIVGTPLRVSVRAQGYEFELYDTHEDSVWSGILTVHTSLETFFAAVLAPEIVIEWADGEVTRSSLPWQTLPPISLALEHKYELTRMVPQLLGSLSTTSRGVLFALMIFFSIVLVLKIVINIRHQHYHVIASTLLLIGFLGLLIIV
jgi:hypothetical protein